MKKILIVSGRSGSGKSSALQALEDLGYYCIDNLPMSLLPEIVEKLIEHQQIERLALGLDIRTPEADLDQFQAIYMQLQQHGHVDVVYFTAQEQRLIARYNATHRPHPLFKMAASLTTALELEERILAPILKQASIVIDTTRFSIHDLRRTLQLKLGFSERMVVVLQSFGYKYGLPLDADFVFDVRYLINPHWYPHLRYRNGLEQEIADFFADHQQVETAIHDLSQFLESWLGQFAANHRHYLTIAIGCTGGQHRSVYVVDRLSKILEAKWPVQISHREMKHWS